MSIHLFFDIESDKKVKHNLLWRRDGGAVAQSVESKTLGEEVVGSIPAVAARSLLVGSVSV